jgi:hypothetical protein
MRNQKARVIRLGVSLLLTALLASCGGSAPPTLVSIAVMPATVSVPNGLTQTLTATGKYSDNSTQDLSKSVTWSSSASSVATVDATGLVKAVAIGTATITATSGAVSNTSAVTLTTAVLQSISIAPRNPDFSLGFIEQMIATGTYSDGSTAQLPTNTGLIWRSSNPLVADIGKVDGIAHSLGKPGDPPGTTIFTATYQNVTGSLTVTFATPSWHFVANVMPTYFDSAGVALPGFKALIVGGTAFDTTLGVYHETNAARLYDLNTGSFSGAPPAATPRAHATATLLPNGLVLVVGGVTSQLNAAGTSYTTTVGVNSAELYDPAHNSWSSAASLATRRAYHTATALNGKVLVVGGTNDDVPGGVGLASAELYDPTSNTWSAAQSLAAGRTSHTAILLSLNGKVLVAGGSDGANVLASAELYDPTSGTWSTVGRLATARAGHAVAPLIDVRVLVVGGYGAGSNSPALASAEIFNPYSNTWSATGSLATARVRHTATDRPTGEVVVVGGSDGSSELASVEAFDPFAETWSTADPLPSPRSGHCAVQLYNDAILVIGDAASASKTSVPDATQLYW